MLKAQLEVVITSYVQHMLKAQLEVAITRSAAHAESTTTTRHYQHNYK